MKITCIGRKVTLKTPFIEKMEKKLSKFNKFFSDEAEATVKVTVEKDWQTVEVTILDQGISIRAEKSARQMEEAIDPVIDILSSRIVRNRKRLNDRLLNAELPNETEPDEADDEDFTVIREKHFFVQPANVEEAILQMNLLGHSFYMFRDDHSGEINVVYKRRDGSYGLLVPEK